MPGDLVALHEWESVPCDIVVVSGEAIVNEESLTGESVPVTKMQLPLSQDKFEVTGASKNVLFSGTRVLRVRARPGATRAIGKVLRTGFSTQKGRLFRNVLHPPVPKFPFYKNAFKFLLINTVFLLLTVPYQYYIMKKLHFTVDYVIEGKFLFKLMLFFS